MSVRLQSSVSAQARPAKPQPAPSSSTSRLRSGGSRAFARARSTARPDHRAGLRLRFCPTRAGDAAALRSAVHRYDHSSARAEVELEGVGVWIDEWFILADCAQTDEIRVVAVRRVVRELCGHLYRSMWRHSSCYAQPVAAWWLSEAPRAVRVALQRRCETLMTFTALYSAAARALVSK